jgi:alanine racemase
MALFNVEGVVLPYHCKIHISQKALHHNMDQFHEYFGHRHWIPVLKSNAYGHGLKEIFEIMCAHPQPPHMIVLNYVAEAAALRGFGFKDRLLIVGPSLEEDFQSAFANDCELTIGQLPLLEKWLALEKRPKIHLKFDSGLTRQGFMPVEWDRVAALVRGHPEVVGISSHFANVEDVEDSHFAFKQLRTFMAAVETLRSKSWQPELHIGSSASGLLMKEVVNLSYVRVGISLYGVWASKLTKSSYVKQNTEMLDLRPVLSWYSVVTTLKWVEAGSKIGYGCTFQAPSNMRLAVVSCGYFEGYPRSGSRGNAFVIINGRRCSVVGRVCMNMLTVDVTHVPQVALGDSVVLIGENGDESVCADTLAATIDTISYEVLSRLSPEIKRIVV